VTWYKSTYARFFYEITHYRQSSSETFSMREKVAEGRMRGAPVPINLPFPLTLALSLMERGPIKIIAED
jgi:hypothetical protein